MDSNIFVETKELGERSVLAPELGCNAPSSEGALQTDGGFIVSDGDDKPPCYNMGVNSSVPPNPKLYHVGLDWLTITCNDRDTSTRLALIATHVAKSYEQDGFHFKPWRFQSGFEGWICGHVRYGERPDGYVILILSGADTAAIWPDVVRLRERINITRVDLQVTVLREDAGGGFIQSVADASAAASRCELQRGRGRPWSVSLWKNYEDQGDTAYIGSRKSDQFGRVYDKYKESAGEYPEGAVRYEVQAKDEMARGLVQALCDGMATKSLDELVTSYVVDWFARRGVDVGIRADAVAPVRVVRSVTDKERQLRWLKRQVRGTVAQLVASGSSGEVLQALGLVQVVGGRMPEVVDRVGITARCRAAVEDWSGRGTMADYEAWAAENLPEYERRRVAQLREELIDRLLVSRSARPGLVSL